MLKKKKRKIFFSSKSFQSNTYFKHQHASQILEDGMSAHGWVRVKTKTDGGAEEFYFMNTVSKKTTWDRPDVVGEIPLYGRSYSQKKKETVAKTSSKDWWAVITQSGETYYMHRVTRKTTWDKPCEGNFETYPKTFGEDTKRKSDDSESSNKIVSSDTATSVSKFGVEDSKARTETTASVPKSETKGLAPLKRGRRISLVQPKKSKWVVRSSGDGTDDQYYLNIETGESSWERPADFLCETEKEITEGDTKKDLSDALESSDVLSIAATKARDLMKVAGNIAAENEAYNRLRFLASLTERHTADAEWSEILESDLGEELVKFVSLHLGKKTSADIRELVGRLLLFFAEAYPECVQTIVANIGGISTFWMHLEQALRESFELKSDAQVSEIDQMSVQAWAKLVPYFVMFAFSGEEDYPKPPSSLASIMFDIMNERLEQRCFLTISTAMAAINMLFSTDRIDENVVMRTLIGNANSEHWGEAIVYQLNETGDKAEVHVKMILRVVEDLFARKITSNYFYTNDLHVIIDIIVRELANLPADSDLRISYLDALENLLRISPWYEKKQYRRESIVSALESIIRAYENDSGFNKGVYERAKSVMGNCRELLIEAQ